MEALPILLLSYLIFTGAAAADSKDGVYIVYMGAAGSANGSPKNDQPLSSLLTRRQHALVHRYRHGISGFAARLSAAEAQALSQEPGVLSVFPDSVFQLHTTRSWDFLKYQTDVVIDSSPRSESDSSSSSRGSDTIIGIIDTGIWPESESFNDKDMGPIPSGWKGTCVAGQRFNSSNCNRKIIGGRFYVNPSDDDEQYNTVRDIIGHGTHVAATAAGTTVRGASYYGLAAGSAKGGSPASRIAVYSVCRPYGCHGSSILAAFDDAIADGVDIISISLGSRAQVMPDFKEDPIAIGAFHAVENGITVVCSAGNDGPASGTVVNSAPWILTVAATTIDRDFESDIVLGSNKVIKGEGINFASIQDSPVHPLIDAKSARRSDADDQAASNCIPDSLDKDKVKGKIVLCTNDDDEYSPEERKVEVQSLGGIGLLLADDQTRAVASNFKEFPMAVISLKDAAEILTYLNSTHNPVATVLPTVTVSKYKPAPAVAFFSSRGPSSISKNILKPDIAAPGVNILAAWKGNDTEYSVEGKEPPSFNLLSGTSMACPHVSGIAAVVKSQYPTWSPSAIKSAIMTTASQTNNMKGSITTDSGTVATPYYYGAGMVNPSGMLQPGLVYETTTIDYLNFLCYHGYNTSTVKIITKTLPDGFHCPEESSINLMSNINYPSIVVSNFIGKQSRNISRTLTNVAGDGDPTYTPTIEAPATIKITVAPDKLQFTENGQRLSYQVIFSAPPPDTNVFGSITWTNGRYKVQTPFVAAA